MALEAMASSPTMMRHHKQQQQQQQQRQQQQRCSMDAICEDIINRSQDSISTTARQLMQSLEEQEQEELKHLSEHEEEDEEEEFLDREVLREDSRSCSNNKLNISLEITDVDADESKLPSEEQELLDSAELLLNAEDNEQDNVFVSEQQGQEQKHRLFAKRTQSASEVRHHEIMSSSASSLLLQTPASAATTTDNSPSSKSVKSLSALTPTMMTTYSSTSVTTSSSRSWSKTFHKSGRKIKKRSLNALFDAVGAGQAVRSKREGSVSSGSSINNNNNNVQTTTTTSPLINRANSVSGNNSSMIGNAKSDLGLVKLDVDNSNGNAEREDDDLNTLHLTRLATSDLRDLERRFHHSSESQNDHEFDPDSQDKRPVPHPQAYFTIDSRRLASRHKKSLRDKKLLYGVKQFNLEPRRGIKFLTESGFLTADDPKNVAHFLFREGRLSKKQIGAFIGGHEPFNQQVLSEFVSLHQFTHLILVQALRQFLWSFRLPGEAMQIDRIMEAFAGHYCQQNPSLFDEPDTCYVICFSIIMLNTALHNPNVKQKISVDQFVRQNRGINSGKDLPRDILELIYRSIKEEPFKIPDETYDDLMYTFFSPEREGWLMKQGGSWKNWKRRWFVLSDRCLYYFQHTAENVPKGIIPLENVRVRVVPNASESQDFCFEVISTVDNQIVKGCKTDSRGTVVQGNHKAYRMSATSEEERQLWVNAISESIREHPFHHIVAAKKAALLRKQQQQHQQQQQQQRLTDSPARTPKKQHSSVLDKILLTPKRRDTPTKKPSESAPDLRAKNSPLKSPKKQILPKSPRMVTREREIV